MIPLDELRHPLCFVRGIWFSLRYWHTLSGHDFEEMPSKPHEQILRCRTCGHESRGVYP